MKRALAMSLIAAILAASAGGDEPPAATAPTAATAPAEPSQPSIQRRGQVIFAAAKASPPAADAIKSSLKDIGHVEATYVSEPLKHWVDGATVKDGVIQLTETVALNRDAGGDAPDEWVAKLTAPLAKGLHLTTLRLAPAVSPEARAECSRVLAEADATLRKRLTELAAQFPALKTTNWGTLEEALSAKGKPGEVTVYAERQQGGPTGVKMPVPPAESYVILVVIRPLRWPVPRDGWTMSQFYSHLPLMGQVFAGSAGDPKLRAELNKLVADVMAPLEQLNDRIASGKPVSTAPAPAPATAPAETSANRRGGTSAGGTDKRCLLVRGEAIPAEGSGEGMRNGVHGEKVECPLLPNAPRRS